MAELEKVIKGLRCCRDIHKGATLDDSCNICPFQVEKGRTCYAEELFFNALALLKAQEPVAPIFDYDGRDVWRCGNCHSNIFHPTRTDEDENEKNYRRFCFHCGRAVKWK